MTAEQTLDARREYKVAPSVRRAEREPGDWRSEAACKGRTEEFFVIGDGEAAERANTAAKAICRTCPVMAECLAYALAAGESTVGVWGATTTRERANMHQRRRRAG